MNLTAQELEALCRQFLQPAGVDEAGRGPLAGPVVAAAVILDPAVSIKGLKDSKKLSAARRESLAGEIRSSARAWSIARASVEEIDSLNILQASLLAMRRAVERLTLVPDCVFVDGNHRPDTGCRAIAVIKGDSLVPAISAASILAKVSRDEEMMRLEEEYPGYGFSQHKGYPTRTHIEAIRRLGVTPLHRRSFSPVKQLLSDEC